MCAGNNELTSITIDDNDIMEKPIYVTSIFSSSYNLKRVNLLLDGLVSFYQLFLTCMNLQHITLKHYTSVNEDRYSIPWHSGYMCATCYSLLTIVFQSIDPDNYLMADSWLSDAYHFSGTQDDQYNPDGLRDGRIYVPDGMVDILKGTSGWSPYASLIYPLSEYVPEEE